MTWLDSRGQMSRSQQAIAVNSCYLKWTCSEWEMLVWCVLIIEMLSVRLICVVHSNVLLFLEITRSMNAAVTFHLASGTTFRHVEIVLQFILDVSQYLLLSVLMSYSVSCSLYLKCQSDGWVMLESVHEESTHPLTDWLFAPQHQVYLTSPE